MEISTESTLLAGAAQLANLAIPSRSTMPTLTAMLLAADQNGLTLSGTDLDISIQIRLPLLPQNATDEHAGIRLYQPGKAMVPAQTFVDLLRRLPATTVRLQTSDNETTHLQAGRTQAQLRGFDPQSYPALPTFPSHADFQIDAGLLSSLIRHSIYAVARDELRPMLTGLYFAAKDGLLTVIATDSHRLVRLTATLETPVSFPGLVLPARSLQELDRALDAQEQVEVAFVHNQVLFQTPRFLFSSRLLDGQYPDTSRIVPTAYPTYVIVDASEMSAALERVILIARENANQVVRLHIASEQLRLSAASPTLGQVEEELSPLQFEGQPLDLACNARYLAEALRNTIAEEVRISLTGPESPFVLTAGEVPQAEAVHLVLPVRIY